MVADTDTKKKKCEEDFGVLIRSAVEGRGVRIRSVSRTCRYKAMNVKERFGIQQHRCIFFSHIALASHIQEQH